MKRTPHSTATFGFSPFSRLSLVQYGDNGTHLRRSRSFFTFFEAVWTLPLGELND